MVKDRTADSSENEGEAWLKYILK